VIIVENRSPDLLEPGFIKGLSQNFRYLLRDEPTSTPVYAVNEAARIWKLAAGPISADWPRSSAAMPMAR
jgi:hypothetical protein